MPTRIGLRRDEGVKAAIVRISHARIPLSDLARVTGLRPPRICAEQQLAETNALGLALLPILHNVAVIDDDDAGDDVVFVQLREVSHFSLP